ncbi:DUF1516 family protein [Bacillus sp. UNCCL13]|uniref:DUF1516 family protein n=1 Tax=unclassified Bacillus (in: firmicutes) TaxID=185979 RepID=UPI0011134404|nr:DUF1516 family protein [Bacillus sp. UNCCL13]
MKLTAYFEQASNFSKMQIILRVILLLTLCTDVFIRILKIDTTAFQLIVDAVLGLCLIGLFFEVWLKRSQ